MRWIVLGVVALASCGRENFEAMDAAPDAMVDARACEAPPNCTQPRVVTCGSSCYVRCLDEVTRPTAAVACVQWGGCLATIASTLENDCVASAIPPDADSWIGLEQAAAATPAAGWAWCDATSFAYTHWNAAEPEDADGIEDGDEQCAIMTIGGEWIDSPCGVTSSFVCER